MKIRNDVNEYGTPIAVYWCDTCGEEYTVCPAPENDDAWQNCLSTECASYDPERDVDKLFDSDSDRIVREPVHRA